MQRAYFIEYHRCGVTMIVDSIMQLDLAGLPCRMLCSFAARCLLRKPVGDCHLRAIISMLLVSIADYIEIKPLHSDKRQTC
jgi:hypothetical protein